MGSAVWPGDSARPGSRKGNEPAAAQAARAIVTSATSSADARYASTRNTTRRFCARPSTVSLGPTGWSSP